MAFTDYKNFAAFQAKYDHISIETVRFIPTTLESFTINPYLKEELEFNLETYKSNEYLASENFVTPILRAAWKPYVLKMNYWSHQSIKYDDDLSGVPDYMFTQLKGRQYEILSYPILTTVEAKAENFVEGWAQCSAQMLACQKLNTKGNATVFGIVTTGKTWEFGKMEGDIITKEPTSYGIDNLQKLMNVLSYILAEAAKQLEN
jgi:hypothetical protein